MTATLVEEMVLVAEKKMGIYLLNAIGLSPGGSGYFTCTHHHHHHVREGLRAFPVP